MTDTAKLNKLIKASGLKKNYIAKAIGMKPASLSRKIHNKRQFKASEINALCNVLAIESLEEKEAIFFADEVAKTATE